MFLKARTLVAIVVIAFAIAAHAQEENACVETSGVHSFKRLGERVEILVNEGDCDAVSLELRWSNGRNNGSNFNVTFFDTANRVIYSKQLFGFMSGNTEFPLSSFYFAPFFGSRALISIPATVTIETVSPFARPASLSYALTRVAPRRLRESKKKSEKETLVQKDQGLAVSERPH